MMRLYQNIRPLYIVSIIFFKNHIKIFLKIVTNDKNYGVINLAIPYAIYHMGSGLILGVTGSFNGHHTISIKKTYSC